MIWMTGLFCIAALGALAAANRALAAARRAAERCDALEGALLDALRSVADVHTSAEGLHQQVRGLAAALDRLQLRRAREEAHAGRAGFDEAIALTRHGADTQELVDACGLTKGEARLVQILYGHAAETRSAH